MQILIFNKKEGEAMLFALKSSKQKVIKKNKAKGMFVVANDRGLHTRPSTEIVKCATSFKSDVKLSYQKLEVNAKSLLGILMLAAAKGAKIKIMAEGEDANEAVETLITLAENNFNIRY
jgi:phosphocarrier protein